MLKKWKQKIKEKSTNITKHMIEEIFKFFTSVTRPAIASISSASFGTILTIQNNQKPFIEYFLQYGSWIIAIIAGLVAIVNGIDNFITKHKQKK